MFCQMKYDDALDPHLFNAARAFLCVEFLPNDMFYCFDHNLKHFASEPGRYIQYSHESSIA